MNIELESIETTGFTIVKPQIDRDNAGKISMNVVPIVGIFKAPQLPGFQVVIDIYGRYKPGEKPDERYQLYFTCTAMLTFIVPDYNAIIKDKKQKEMTKIATMMVSVAYSTMRGIVYEKTHSIIPDLVLPLAVPNDIPSHVVDEESIQEYLAEKELFVRSLLEEKPLE
jgi:hypothetical protein